MFRSNDEFEVEQVRYELEKIIVPFLEAYSPKLFTQEDLIEQLNLKKILHALKEATHSKNESLAFHNFLCRLVATKKIKCEGKAKFYYSAIQKS